MRTATWVGILAVLLSACAGMAPGTSMVPGTSREADVIAHFGQPAQQRNLPDGGKVLDFPRSPLGYECYRVTLDKDGVVRAVEQLLDAAHFALLRPGMSMDEVKEILGRPADTSNSPRLAEVVITWRFMDGPTRMFFFAHFDAATGRLKYTSRKDEMPPTPG